MTRLRDVKLQRAKDYIMAHPDESKRQQATAAGCSIGYIALARKALIDEGRLAPSRKANVGNYKRLPPPAPAPIEGSGTPEADAAYAMKDSAAMLALTEATAALSDDELLDDEVVYKRFLRQVINFAMDPGLHPDTRMSAQTLWMKFRDNARVKDLGPGVPLTFEAGVARLADIMTACGPTMTLAAVNVAFETGASNGKADDPGVGPSGPAPTPSAP